MSSFGFPYAVYLGLTLRCYRWLLLAMGLVGGLVGGLNAVFSLWMGGVDGVKLPVKLLGGVMLAVAWWLYPRLRRSQRHLHGLGISGVEAIYAHTPTTLTNKAATTLLKHQYMAWWVVVGSYCCSPQAGLLVWLGAPVLFWGWLFPNRLRPWRQLMTATGLGLLLLWWLPPASPPSASSSHGSPMGLVSDGWVILLSIALLNGTLALYRWLQKQHLTVQTLQAQASTDALTGLLNRRHFDQQLTIEIARARRHNSPLSLVIMDIDHFKQINDQFGHSIGDLLLKELGAVILEQIREHDAAARYGGEEFALILPETTAEAACEMLERVHRSIGNHTFGLPQHPLGITLSVGIASFNPHEDVIFNLIERADIALYAAKHNGRNQVVYGVEPLPVTSLPLTS
jgi:diguanylate cyclase (GGDEF)-like protein